MLPEDTTFDPAQPQAQCWWTSSGHLLLQPTIDGQQLGWMLLDTGWPPLSPPPPLSPTLLSLGKTLPLGGSFPASEGASPLIHIRASCPL